MSNADKFIELPPQGYEDMTPLERLDHKVRCAVIDAKKEDAGVWNILTALKRVMIETEKLSEQRAENEEKHE